jgi:hypothetical protein
MGGIEREYTHQGCEREGGKGKEESRSGKKLENRNRRVKRFDFARNLGVDGRPICCAKKRKW